MLDLRTTAATSARPLSLWRLILIGVFLPAAIATVNYSQFRSDVYSAVITLSTYVQFAWYIAQVGLVGFVVGRWIDQAVPRWLMFGWILLFIDLLAASFAMNSGNVYSALLSAGLWSGQMGLCVVWAFLGDTRWVFRWPAMIVATVGLYFLWLTFGDSWSQRVWNELLLMQLGTLSVMCGLLGLARFRLRYIEPDTGTARDAARRPLQFGIKHVLIWTTALAILLGVARGLDLLHWQVALELVRVGLPWKLTVSIVSAMVIVVALWAALGHGHWLLRYVAAVIFTLAVGSGLANWSLANAATTWRKAFITNWNLLAWYEIGWGWLGWMFLSGGLLAATLIILRTRGYRLVRLRS